MKKFLAFTSQSSTELVWSTSLKTDELKKNQILCSISGGQDSVVNFFILLNFFSFENKKNNKLKSNFKIVYFQHFWQIKSFFLPFFLFRLSFLYQTPYLVILPITVFLTENESRNWRKKNYFRICQVDKISTFFTGHTQTDLLEKNLNNLLRGTSPKSFMGQNLLSHGKHQTFLFSCFFINSIWGFQLRKNTFLDQLFNFGMLNSFFYLENKGLNKKKFPNKFFVLNKTNFNSKIFLFEPTLFSTKIMKFKVEDSLFQNNFSSSSFSVYSNYYSLKINLHKPLESSRRSTISELVTFFDFPLLIDLTNYSKDFSRNKIRHEMLPFMKSIYHKKIENSLKNFFHLVLVSSVESQIDRLEYYFLYKILVFTNRNQKKSLILVNNNLTNRVQSYFLQKLVIDSKNIELNFSQTTLIQKKLFVKRVNFGLPGTRTRN